MQDLAQHKTLHNLCIYTASRLYLEQNLHPTPTIVVLTANTCNATLGALFRGVTWGWESYVIHRDFSFAGCETLHRSVLDERRLAFAACHPRQHSSH